MSDAPSEAIARTPRDPLGLEAVGRETVKTPTPAVPRNGKGRKPSLHKQRAALCAEIDKFLVDQQGSSRSQDGLSDLTESVGSNHEHRGAASSSDSDSETRSFHFVISPAF